MFYFDSPKEYHPFNIGRNFNLIQKIKITDLRYFDGSNYLKREESKLEEENLEIKIYYIGGMTEEFLIESTKEKERFYAFLFKIGLNV